MGNETPRVAPGQNAPPPPLRGRGDERTEQPPTRRQEEERIPVVSDFLDLFHTVTGGILRSAPAQPVEPPRPPAAVTGTGPRNVRSFGGLVQNITGEGARPTQTTGTGIRVTNDAAAVPDPRVKTIQDQLRYLGYFRPQAGQPAPTPRDGVFDSTTHDAMTRFQGNFSGADGEELPVMPHNGELDQRSINRLSTLAGQREVAIGQRQVYENLGNRPLREGQATDADRADRLRAKQALGLLGYETTPGADFDAKTMEQLRSFQRDYSQHTGEDLGNPDALGPRVGGALRRSLQQAEVLGRTEPWRSHVEREIANNPLGQRVLRPEEVDRRGNPVRVQRSETDAAVINQVQQRLGQLGYTMTNGSDMNVTRPMEPDRFTPQMAAAIADFQRVYSWMPGNSPILPNGQLNARTVAALNSPAAEAAINRLDELRPGLRNAFVVDGYTRGVKSPMVVRSMGQSPDGDNPSKMRDRYLETRPAMAFVALQQQARERDGVDLLAGSGFRPHAEQSALFAGNRSRRSKAAPPGFSNHQGGRALDFVLAGDRGQAWMRRNGNQYGFRMLRGGNEDHHGDYVVGDITPHVRQQLGFNAGGMEAEPERVVQRGGRGRSTRNAPRHVSRSRRRRR